MTRTRRGARTAVCLLAALALALGTAASASAATPTPTPAPAETPAPGTQIVYAGHAALTDISPDGRTEPGEGQDVTLTISCTADDACAISGWPLSLPGDAFPYTGPSGTWDFPLEGTWCGPDGRRPRTMTLVSATGSELVGTVDSPVSGWMDCDGTNTNFWGLHYEMTLAYVSGNVCVIEATICPPEPEVEAEPVAAADEPVTAAPVPRTATSPTVLSALLTPAETLSVQQCALAALLAVILALLMGFPTHLIGKVSDELGARLGTWWRRVRPPRATGEAADADAEAQPATIRATDRFRGWLPAALGVLAAALITSFVDPAFGFDAASLRQFGSIAIGFALDVVVGWFVLIWVVGRLHPQATAAFEFRPLTLLVVVATVVFTRLTGFQPGIVFGLVAGVAFGTAIATSAAKARLTLITLGWGLGLALLAWVGYTLLQDAGDDLGTVFLRETLASLTAAGVSALPIALLPVRGLTGSSLFAWNRIVWGGVYAAGLLAFFLVLMPMPTSWAEVPFALWTWVGMYAAYAAVALGLWVLVTRPWRRDGQRAASPPTEETAASSRSTTSDA
ncbi:hypothetical protein [Protaetiibacter intestinalis]|uniref:Uncharacterized protein n=1 Tax=Protaetiibacter intestinalis TaxID=2419774 RepID=A0A387BAH9_9MICO|nr:hypothetical protein [Protaetiibacter intestinalis]AYF98911.1 hypothetical protein D7I47_12030 [Protaetiibacter intestinalis]